ncbi:MAG TPA: hypothetical protein VIQ11_17235, partial [Mycobacterium sp.]
MIKTFRPSGRLLGRLVAAGLTAGTVVLGGVLAVAAPAANAYPGDPMPGCETQVFATYCDGPIR